MLLPTGPAYGRSPGDPYFDPIYARLQEAGCILVFHIMPFWYFDAISPAWGHNPDPASWHMSAWQWMNVYGQRPIEDTLSALDLRQPLRPLPGPEGPRRRARRGMGAVLRQTHGQEPRHGPQRSVDRRKADGAAVGDLPASRPVWCRIPRTTSPRSSRAMGYDDCLVMGSDYPHAEGLAEPADFVKLLDPLDDAAKRRIMRDNAEQLLRRS